MEVGQSKAVTIAVEVEMNDVVVIPRVADIFHLPLFYPFLAFEVIPCVRKVTWILPLENFVLLIRGPDHPTIGKTACCLHQRAPSTDVDLSATLPSRELPYISSRWVTMLCEGHHQCHHPREASGLNVTGGDSSHRLEMVCGMRTPLTITART